MRHPGLTANRIPFRQPFILCVATLCLLALFCLAQSAHAADQPATPDLLGSISGVVTDEAGTPLADINVGLITQGGSYYANIKTDANGAYQLTFLPPGVYLLQMSDLKDRFVTQWHAHSLFRAQATPIVVAGHPVTGINTSLTLGGHLTGTVTVQQLGTANSGYMNFYTQQDGQWQIVSTSSISQTGHYVSGALQAGVYRICGNVYISGTGYALTGCYGGADVTQATSVPLSSTETITNLNMDVGEGEFNSVISGVITGDGSPKAGIKVSVYGSGYPYGVIGNVYSFTDAAGRYTIGGLPDGSYRVGFSDPAGIYATTYYTKVQFLADAPSVALEDSQVISNVNVTLTHGGTLQGNVHRYTDAPVPNVTVSLLSKSENFFHLNWDLTEVYTVTDAAGNYTFRGLWPGTYRVGVACYAYYELRCTEFYGSKTSVFFAQDVIVQADQATTGIDVTFGFENPVFMPIIQKSSTP